MSGRVVSINEVEVSTLVIVMFTVSLFVGPCSVRRRLAFEIRPTISYSNRIRYAYVFHDTACVSTRLATPTAQPPAIPPAPHAGHAPRSECGASERNRPSAAPARMFMSLFNALVIFGIILQLLGSQIDEIVGLRAHHPAVGQPDVVPSLVLVIPACSPLHPVELLPCC